VKGYNHGIVDGEGLTKGWLLSTVLEVGVYADRINHYNCNDNKYGPKCFRASLYRK
jgi:hypothetical protein